MILLKHDFDCLKKVSQVLCAGEVVIIPTDTVYGFSGLVPGTDSLIRDIKGRGESKPFIQLIADSQDLLKYTDTPIPEKVQANMPGALTVIVKNRENTGTTAFRCPNDEWLRSLIRLCGHPLYSTSTNRSGEPVINTVSELEKEFGGEVFCIVDDGKESNSQNTTVLPSTIVDITKGEILIVRQGSVLI
ncbi:MAG: L-threonylcarbamoyladenylate synthase [Spirochaetales bacterium]